jgi:hypothetical protein
VWRICAIIILEVDMSGKLDFYIKRFGLFLVMIALTATMEGCIFGSPSQNIEIRTWYDLEAIRDDPSGDYTLMNNLDSTTDGYDELASPTANDGKGWHPLNGPGLEGDNPPFTGTLDGQGYEIRDIFIDLPKTGYVGLFSVVGEEGRIENIGVVNADVTSTAYIGILVGVNGGTVSGSYSTGSVTGDDYLGGLVGSNAGSVSNSYATGSVTGNYLVGGLVGKNDGTVNNCYSTGSITSNSAAGGLMGANTGVVNNSYATGNVTGDSGAGGLMAANSGTVSNSYSTGNVNGNDYLGGLVAYGEEGTVSDSFWDTETSGQSTSDGGTGKTTTEMKSIATFSGAGWNIIEVADLGTRNLAYIWNIVTGGTYPFFSLQS